MRMAACLTCALFLFFGAATRVPAAVRGTSNVKTKTTHSFSLTPTVGEYFFDGREKLNPSQIYGLTFSYTMLNSEMMNSLEIDATAGYIDTTSKVDNSSAQVYHFRVDGVYPFILKNSGFSPFFAVGVGGNFYERNTTSDNKFLVDYGFGLKYKLRDYLDVRADVRHLVVVNSERDNNVELTLGLTYIFGVDRKQETKEPDKGKKDKDDKKGKRTKTLGNPEESTSLAKMEKGNGKDAGEKASQAAKKPESTVSAVGAGGAAVPIPTGNGPEQTQQTDAKTAARQEE
ncbi:MAG TPA: outer membrane beta-barrel protein, partial [Geobacteraceae bacterium]|nr:outer membrane beta-barrel protein [Geobacteraceae bacterium]